MNTITTTTPEGDTISYTEAEVLHFRKRAGEIDAVQQLADSNYKEIRSIRNEIRDFFSEVEWQDSRSSRDRYGRPMVVPPKGGKAVPYTRTTTVAGSLDDGTALVAWKLRMAAAGLTLRPDLLLAASAARDNKLEMDKLVEDAMTAAGATAQATIGTAIHTLTEKHDRGRRPWRDTRRLCCRHTSIR
jgi:hypothetical protein